MAESVWLHERGGQARDDGRRLVRLPRIDPQRCTGCGRCVGACGLHLLSLQATHWRKHAVLHAPPACTGCAACAVVCPFHAIAMRAPAAVSGETRPGRKAPSP